MKLLVVDNGWIRTERQETLVDPRAREFLLDCSRRFDGTIYLCSSPSSSLEKYRGVPLDCDRVRAVSVPARGRRRWSRAISYLCSLKAIWRVVREADFLYVFFPGNVPLLSVGVSRLLRKPYGVYLRGELGMDSRWWRCTMSGAKFVIATGVVLANAARRYCDDVDLAVPLCPLPTIPPDRRGFFRTEGPWRFLYVGRLEERKGTLELLEAMTLLRQRGVDFRLDLVGQNWLDRMPEHAAILGDRINCVGVVNDDELLGRYYREADLFCFPSHDEGFPRVLYEAMLHGTPIVTTFVGSISSVMEDSMNCLRVDVRSPVALADTIERTLRSPDLRKRLSDNGYATMEPILRRMKAGNHAKQVFCKATAHRANGKERP